MDISEIVRALGAADIRVQSHGADYVVLDNEGRATLIEAKTSPRPSQVRHALERANGDRVLVVAHRASPAVRELAARDDRIIIIDTDEHEVWANRQRNPFAEKAPKPRLARGRRPHVAFACARVLALTDAPQTQSRLAAQLHVSQPAIAKALDHLAHLTERTPRGWVATDRSALFDYAATTYPGPEGTVSYWWSRDDLETQAATVLEAAPDALISGDLAARRIHGWRMPEHATLYLRDGIDMRRLRFAAATPDDYTISITVPKDRTLWATARAWSHDRIADPVIVYRDMRATGTTGDQDEAAEKVKHTAVHHETTSP